MAIKVVAEVVEVKGTGECSAGHKPGDKFVFTEHMPAGLCRWAVGALAAPVSVLLNGGNFSWAPNGEPTRWGCPDPTETVVFELRLEKD